MLVIQAEWNHSNKRLTIHTSWTKVNGDPVIFYAENISSLKEAQRFIYDMGWGTITVSGKKPDEPCPY